MGNVNVVIVDEHQFISKKLVPILKINQEIFVINKNMSLEDCLTSTNVGLANLLVVHLDLAILNSLNVLEQIKKKYPELKILIISSQQDKDICTLIKDTNVDGLIHTSYDKNELYFVTDQIFAGEKYCYFDRLPVNERKHQDLTKREIEILKLIVLGKTNLEISKLLFISDRTVDTHRTNLMRKLRVNNVAGLIHFAYSNKIIDEFY